MTDSSRGVSKFGTPDLSSLLASFAQRWHQGETPSLEKFLAQTPESDTQSLFRELLQVELRCRRERGQQPTPADYINRFPDVATVVNEVFGADASTVTFDGQANTAQALDDDATLAPRSNDDANASGTRSIGDYELLHEIARGGMGVVYKARQTSLNRSVALKMILTGQLASADDVERFRMEAGAAAQLDHPGIVPIYEIGEHAGQPYFSMGLVEGESLAARIKDGPLTPREAAQWVASIAEAVDYAHQRGVVHRDLKPGNVLIDQHGTPKVTDFGLAKRVDADSNLTGTGDILGTPSYMPPEQAGGELEKIGPASDIYSLGAVLYCLLTARPPFQAARPLDTVLQVIGQDPVSPKQLNPAVDKDLETICLKCLEKSAERRYETAAALKSDLDRFLKGEPIHARRISPAAKVWRWCRRKPLVAGLIAAVGISLIVGVSFSTYFAMEARVRARQAEEGRAIALSTLETMIKDVQRQLRPIPAAREIRRELLRNSLAELERVSGEIRLQRRVDLSTARALVDLAGLFEELGNDEGLDASETAETHYQDAVAIYRELNESPDADLQLRQEFSNALADLGNFYLNVKRVPQAKQPLFESLEMGRDITQQLPIDSPYWRDFAWILGTCGDWHAMRRSFRDALPFFGEAEQIVRRLLEEYPDDPVYQERLAAYLEKAGDAHHDLKQNRKALERFQTVLEIRQKLYDSDPESSFMLDSMAYIHERLGNHWMQVGDPKRAQDIYRKMVELNQQAIQRDPASRTLQQGQAIYYLKLAKASQQVGDLEEAKEARQKAAEIRRRLAGKSE